MTEQVKAMGGEPWCFPPETIAGLTDWQVLNVYVRPAVERLKALDGGGGPGPMPPQKWPPDREEFIASMMATAPGKTRGHWEAMHDRILLEYEEHQRRAESEPEAK